MNLTLAQAIGQKMMLGFVGTEPSAEIRATLERQHVGGITLYRSLNVEHPAQVRALAEELQNAAHASGQPPLLIAVDQEGGTLFAIGGTTRFPGNLALGATGSAGLARRTGYAMGRELAAMGINLNYAPVCDVIVNPENPVVGPRSFGEDPARVAELCAAMVIGFQEAGVAACAKHFPGHGDTATDSHHATPVLSHDLARLRQVELVPFVAAVHAGTRVVMTGHVALPGLNEGADLPATLSSRILQGLLRDEVGFQGVIISDAMEMNAIRQGEGFPIDTIAAVRAGVDLVLLNANAREQQTVYAALVQATEREIISRAQVMNSVARVLALKDWCAQRIMPALDIIDCAEHRTLADEIARQAVTLVRDEMHQVPLRLSAEARLAVIVPQPEDLTPADTSSYDSPALAEAIRAYHTHVDEFIVRLNPTDAEIAALRERTRRYDHFIVGTINANLYPGQSALIQTLSESGVPLVVVALRMPHDLTAFKNIPTYVCTYSLQPASLAALAQALWGEIPFPGRLPVSIPGLYERGHGISPAR